MWPTIVLGWSGPILAIIFSVVGIVRARVAWLIAAAVVILPFSLYLGLSPRVQWGISLPLLPLIAARATSRGSKLVAWLSVLLLTAIVLWIAGIVFAERQKHRHASDGNSANDSVWIGGGQHADRPMTRVARGY